MCYNVFVGSGLVREMVAIVGVGTSFILPPIIWITKLEECDRISACRRMPIALMDVELRRGKK